MKRIILVTALLLALLYSGCEKNTNKEVVLKIFGDAYEDIAYSISSSEGDVILAGLRTVITRRDGNYIETSDRKMGVIRASSAGMQKWEATPGTGVTSQASRVIVLPGGEIVAAGLTTKGTGTTAESDIYIVKLSSAGSVIWESRIGGPGNQSAADIAVTPTGGFMVAGLTDAYRSESGGFGENIAGMKDFFLLEINSAGDSIASYAFGYSGNDLCTSIRPDVNGGYILYGTTDNKSEPGLDKNSLLLIRINGDASIRESILVGDLTDQYAADLEVLADGYLLAATVGKGNESTQIQIIRLNSNIQTPARFNRKFDINGQASSVNAISAGDGVFYLGGRLGIPSSSDNLILVIDADGNQLGDPFISGGSGSQEIFDLLLADDGFLYAVGKTGYENNTMMCLLKFRF
jgi:hypothetical protein